MQSDLFDPLSGISRVGPALALLHRPCTLLRGKHGREAVLFHLSLELVGTSLIGMRREEAVGGEGGRGPLNEGEGGDRWMRGREGVWEEREGVWEEREGGAIG